MALKCCPLLWVLPYYIAVLAKMQFFKISVILCFSVDFFFFLFFLPPTFLGRLLTDLHQIWHGRPIWYAIYTEARFFGKVQKPGHNGQKTSKNRSFFHLRRHIFARCDETVKVFWKIFSAITTRVLHLSENVFAIVQNQNRPVFSNTLLNGASKNTNFEVDYFANGTSYDQSLY